MKTGVLVCTFLFVLAALLALLQMWFVIMDGDLFIKLMITLGVCFVVALGITLVRKEYLDEKKLKDSGYIDS